jgi:hypothetical protein
MSYPKYLTTVYTTSAPSDVCKIAKESAEAAGLGHKCKRQPEENRAKLSMSTGELYLGIYPEHSELHERKIDISIEEKGAPEKWYDDADYQEFFDDFVEFLCQLAIQLDAEYVALFENVHWNDVVPSDAPLSEHIDQVPRLAIYSESLLDDLGGLNAIRDQPPWRVGDLENGSTLVIWSDEPWGRSGWTESTHRELRAPQREAEADESEDISESNQELQLSDPFAALETGAQGTDVCVRREDIAAEFRNEDLHLVRVYIDENRDLRRLDDDTFVRNVVDEELADHRAVIEAQLADIPPDATEGDLMVSALLHSAIPPAFVRLDSPNGETVASRVMDLDVDTNKQELLISLGRAVQHENGSTAALQTVEQALDKLTELEGVEGVDDWIEANLL